MASRSRNCRECAVYPGQRGARNHRWKGGYYSIYGITPEKYQFMFQMQQGLCGICGNAETNKDQKGRFRALSVDHVHGDEDVKQRGNRPTEVRGLLCGNCNRGLGLFKDDPSRLEKAASYLLKHTATMSALQGASKES